MAKQENFRVNLIEAYDQPWKRQLEGTVGGYWGMIDSVQRRVKYPPGEAISNFPFWKLQMGCGMALSILVFGAAWLTLRRRPWTPRLASWIAVGISATAAGILLGVAGDKMFYESYGFGGWLRWGALLAAAIASPLLCANALMSGRALPTFLELLGPRGGRAGSALTMAVVPFSFLALLNRPQAGVRPIAEVVFAGLLAGAALYTIFNEGSDNWQSLWTCAVYFLFAVTLWRARAVQIPK